MDVLKALKKIQFLTMYKVYIEQKLKESIINTLNCNTYVEYRLEEQEKLKAKLLANQEETNELKRSLDEYLDKLEYSEKKIICLYYYENKKMNEISKAIGYSERHTKRLRKKALDFLQNCTV